MKFKRTLAYILAAGILLTSLSSCGPMSAQERERYYNKRTRIERTYERIYDKHYNHKYTIIKERRVKK